MTMRRIDIHTHVAFPEVLAMARAIKLRGSGPGGPSGMLPGTDWHGPVYLVRLSAEATPGRRRTDRPRQDW